MNPWTRRSMLVGTGAAALAASTTQPPTPTSRREEIDRRVMEALNELVTALPGAAELAAQAEGILVITDIATAGLVAGGAYGEGALMVGPNRAIVDYYSLSEVSLGLQAGAAAFNQALFFMTGDALQDFRVADGWTLGAGASVVIDQEGAAAGIDSLRINRPIVEVVFGQRGLLIGASLEGALYNRIVR